MPGCWAWTVRSSPTRSSSTASWSTTPSRNTSPSSIPQLPKGVAVFARIAIELNRKQARHPVPGRRGARDVGGADQAAGGPIADTKRGQAGLVDHAAGRERFAAGPSRRLAGHTGRQRVGIQRGGGLEEGLRLCPIEDRWRLDSPREGMLEGFSLRNYLLLVDYAGRLFPEGKAVISAELGAILRRLGSSAENWQARLRRLASGRLLRRFFAAMRSRLREVAQRLGVHRLANLAGCAARRGRAEPQSRFTAQSASGCSPQACRGAGTSKGCLRESRRILWIFTSRPHRTAFHSHPDCQRSPIKRTVGCNPCGAGSHAGPAPQRCVSCEPLWALAGRARWYRRLQVSGTAGGREGLSDVANLPDCMHGTGGPE